MTIGQNETRDGQLQCPGISKQSINQIKVQLLHRKKSIASHQQITGNTSKPVLYYYSLNKIDTLTQYFGAIDDIDWEQYIYYTHNIRCSLPASVLYTCHIPLYFLNYRSMYSSRVLSFFSFISFFGGFFFFCFQCCCLCPVLFDSICCSSPVLQQRLGEKKRTKKKRAECFGGLSLLMAEPCSTIERTKRSLLFKTFVLGLFSFAGLSPR